MGKWLVRKPEPTDIQGLCIECKEKPQRRLPKGTYAAYCSVCYKVRYEGYKPRTRKTTATRKTLRRKHLKTSCEMCHFVPVHRCQLDLDHVDGNSNNNDADNFQTLCANCHRLKTVLNRDYRQNQPPSDS